MALNLSAEQEELFWSYVDKGDDDDCWEWLGGQSGDGYGGVQVGDKKLYAHRVAFELDTGKAPGNLCVCHTCDNPLCCNPAHLFLGTHADNMRDKAGKGRAPKGEAHGNSKLTEQDVREIRRLHATGDYSLRELAAAFGVAHSNIGYIVNKKLWGWLS